MRQRTHRLCQGVQSPPYMESLGLDGVGGMKRSELDLVSSAVPRRGVLGLPTSASAGGRRAGRDPRPRTLGSEKRAVAQDAVTT